MLTHATSLDKRLIDGEENWVEIGLVSSRKDSWRWRMLAEKRSVVYGEEAIVEGCKNIGASGLRGKNM